MIDFHKWKLTEGFKKRPSLEQRMGFVEAIRLRDDPKELAILAYDFQGIWGRDEQMPYYFNNDWTTWMYCAGRGSGKTRAGAEWVRWLIFDKHKNDPIRIGIICPTAAAADSIIFNGDSGFLTILPPHERAQADYNVNANRVRFSNGSEILCYSAETGEKNLRGPQWHYLWMDETAAWQDREAVLSMVPFCLRLKPPGGGEAQKIITSTPKPDTWLRQLYKQALHDDSIIFSRGSSYDNAMNLSKTLFDDIVKYEGTVLGRQEIHAEILLENTNGIIKRDWIKLWSADKPLPKLQYVFNSYDTAFTEKKTNDPSACLSFGLFVDRDDELSLILLNAWSEHLEYPDLRAQLLIDWETRYGYKGDVVNIDRFGNELHDLVDYTRRPDAFIIENKASGQALMRDINRTGIKVLVFSPGRGDDKEARMNTISYLIKDGRLYVPESKRNPGLPLPTFTDFIEQVVNFPLVDHDDYCDALSQALILFARGDLISGERTIRGTDEDKEDEDRFMYYSPKKSNPYMN